MTYLSRADWGAAPPNRPSPARDATTHVIVHHFATELPDDLAETIEQQQSVQADHLARIVFDADGEPIIDPATGEPLRWADFAYNVSVGREDVLEGRGFGVVSGGTGRGNKVRPPAPYTTWDQFSVSLAVMGNFETDDLDARTETGVVAAFRMIRALYGDDLIVLGDRDVNSTKCCGSNLYSQLGRLWAASAAPTGTHSEAPMTIHTPTVRDGSPDVLDFTYLPRSGDRVGSTACMSHVVIRNKRQGQQQDVQVFFDGQPIVVTLGADGRTVAVPVTAAGLVSIVGVDIIAEAREIWVSA